MGMDHVGPPAVHHPSRARGRGGVQPVAVIVLLDTSRRADPLHRDAVDDLGRRCAVGQAERDRSGQHHHLVTGGGHVLGDASQLQGRAAREVGRVVGGHVEDAHRARRRDSTGVAVS
jgi:hypothetical protein